MTSHRPSRSRPSQSRISRSYNTGRDDSDRACSEKVDKYLENKVQESKRARETSKDETNFQYENGRVNAFKEAQLDLIRKGSRNPTKYVLTKN